MDGWAHTATIAVVYSVLGGLLVIGLLVDLRAYLLARWLDARVGEDGYVVTREVEVVEESTGLFSIRWSRKVHRASVVDRTELVRGRDQLRKTLRRGLAR